MAAGSAKAGRLFIIKIGDGGGSEVFTAVGGLKSSAIKLSAEQIDITDMASADWRYLLTGYGIKSFSISGTGVFTYDTYEALVKAKFLANAQWNYQLVDSDGHYWQGAFMCKSLEYKGSDKDAVTYSFTLESTGPVTYT